MTRVVEILKRSEGSRYEVGSLVALPDHIAETLARRGIVRILEPDNIIRENQRQIYENKAIPRGFACTTKRA